MSVSITIDVHGRQKVYFSARLNSNRVATLKNKKQPKSQTQSVLFESSTFFD